MGSARTELLATKTCSLWSLTKFTIPSQVQVLSNCYNMTSELRSALRYLLLTSSTSSSSTITVAARTILTTATQVAAFVID